MVIDAIVGYSLKGEPKGKALELIQWAEHQLSIILSLDVPSRIDASSGKSAKHFIKPDLTLTLALPKTGLVSELSGELFLGDIGIPQKVYDKLHFNYKSPFGTDSLLKLQTVP